MAYETILSQVEDGFGIVQMNRPETMNAIDGHMLGELHQVLHQYIEDASVKAIIVTGGLRMFAAGGDIKELKPMDVWQAQDFIEQVNQVVSELEDCPKPTIAAMNGFVLDGGLELAMACDLRIASEKATFGFPEINLGIHPGAGGTQRLARLVGLGKARELILSGEFIDADAAWQIGLVNEVVPADQVMLRARALGTKLIRKPPQAFRLAKRAIHAAMDNDIRTGSAIEREGFALLFTTRDQKEGMHAFLTGRRPTFTGH
ncbi:MAG: enoyl-CoA hydratase/isomerase family protein [Solirubrobacterales bacterium]